MADTILIRTGTKNKIPVLLYRELGYCYDTQELYIGTGAGNLLVGAVAWETDISSLKLKASALEDEKLTATQAETVAQLGGEAETAELITKINELITALQTAGIMKR